MWIQSVFFTSGVLLCQLLTDLPAIYPYLACAALLFLLRRIFWARLALFFLSGFCWSLWMANLALADRISADAVNHILIVTGKIVDLPVYENKSWRFNFSPLQAFQDNSLIHLPKKIRLSWYHTDLQLAAGQHWRLSVKLKPPFGKLNPGVFDYETWLFQQGIGAKGYVLKHSSNQMLMETNWYQSFGVVREKLRKGMRKYANSPDALAIMQALTVGDKSSISPRMWDIFSKTGINHLIAISGLHITIVSMAAYWMVGLLWRLSSSLCLLLPAPQVQVLAGLMAAVVYAGLAGFSLPTQRALIMLSAVLISRLSLVNAQPARQLSVAVFAVLLWDPIAVISPGFWFSFLAVIAIFLVIYGHRIKSQLVSIIAIQWNISLWLLPLTLYLFKQVSVISPLVNLLVIPLFSLFYVPAGMFLALLNLAQWQWVNVLTEYYLVSVEQFVLWLQIISQLSWVVLPVKAMNPAVYFLLIMTAIFWNLPGKYYPKTGAVVFFLVSLSVPKNYLPDNQLKLTLLDVGQGLSVFLKKGDKTLLYDLGPRYGANNSATDFIVLPFLKSLGINSIDKLIISHSDSDHSGDLSLLLANLQVAEIFAGEPVTSKVSFTQCQTGQSWQWGETVFKFLYPVMAGETGNNASCVLKITHGNISILLTGDIEKDAENLLVKHDAGELSAQVVVIPHHGSATSSTAAFIQAVNPQVILNSSAYLNRYRFPSDRVKQRWLQTEGIFLDTAEHGAIEIEINDNGTISKIAPYRSERSRYWYWDRNQAN